MAAAAAAAVTTKEPRENRPLSLAIEVSSKWQDFANNLIAI